VVSESPYEAPGMDPRLLGQIISVKVQALKGQWRLESYWPQVLTMI